MKALSSEGFHFIYSIMKFVLLGTFDNYAPKEFFRPEIRLEPEPVLREAYDSYYGVYRDLNKSLNGAFEGMHQAAQKVASAKSAKLIR